MHESTRMDTYETLEQVPFALGQLLHRSDFETYDIHTIPKSIELTLVQHQKHETFFELSVVNEYHVSDVVITWSVMYGWNLMINGQQKPLDTLSIGKIPMSAIIEELIDCAVEYNLNRIQKLVVKLEEPTNFEWDL